MARIGETSLHGAVDGALELVGDEEAAVGIGADGQRLGFEVAQVCSLALSDVAVEGGAVLEGCAGADCGTAEMGARGLEGELVDDALVVVERAADAIEAVGGDDVGRHAALELAETLVVAVLEGLEGAHEVAEGGVEIVGVGGFGFELVHGVTFWRARRRLGRASAMTQHN